MMLWYVLVIVWSCVGGDGDVLVMLWLCVWLCVGGVLFNDQKTRVLVQKMLQGQLGLPGQI